MCLNHVLSTFPSYHLSGWPLLVRAQDAAVPPGMTSGFQAGRRKGQPVCPFCKGFLGAPSNNLHLYLPGHRCVSRWGCISWPTVCITVLFLGTMILGMRLCSQLPVMPGYLPGNLAAWINLMWKGSSGNKAVLLSTGWKWCSVVNKPTDFRLSHMTLYMIFTSLVFCSCLWTGEHPWDYC